MLPIFKVICMPSSAITLPQLSHLFEKLLDSSVQESYYLCVTERLNKVLSSYIFLLLRLKKTIKCTLKFYFLKNIYGEVYVFQIYIHAYSCLQIQLHMCVYILNKSINICALLNTVDCKTWTPSQHEMICFPSVNA